MSLPAAEDLRARAARVIAGAALRGTPRRRFLREQRRRLVARLLPTLSIVAVAMGASATVDIVRSAPTTVTLTEGVLGAVLAALALASTLARRSLVALLSIALAGAIALVIGVALVISETGGAESPNLFVLPMGVSILTIAVPLLPWQPPVLAALGAAGLAVSAPGASWSAYVALALLGAGGLVIARARRARALVAFRRVERLAASVAKIRRVQEQLLVVEKLEALRVLVGGVAHELNNALTVSLASTEQVVRVVEADPPAAARAAERAQRGLVRIRGTIDRLKRFALAGEGVLEPADLCAMLDFALENAVGRARSGVSIERRYDEELPPIDTHVAALAEALFQVARNAVESMPAGGTIRASVRREGARVLLAVADEGQGIPPERLAKVFDPFYARESPDITLSRGRILAPIPGKSGLGLSAVYGLVSAIGGAVDITSQVGKGTTVSIRLPAAARARATFGSH
jgi:signal transduction histidine kinase